MSKRNRHIFDDAKYCESLTDKCNHLQRTFSPMQGYCREFKSELDGINCCYLKCAECLIEFNKENKNETKN